MENFEEKTESEGLTVSRRSIHCPLAERVTRVSSRRKWNPSLKRGVECRSALFFDNMIEFVSL